MTISISARPIQQASLEVKLPVIKVLGLGGGGTNAINRMIELGISGVEYIAANTDSQSLRSSLAPTKIHLGPSISKGFGSGGDPKVGESAAEESLRELNAALSGADMVFLAAGMGGGTGTGSIPVAARVARSLGAVTIAIVTTPFSFEVGKRQKNAQQGLNLLYQYTDTLITVPNDRLLQIAPKDLPLELAFRMADDMLRQGIQGISELVLQPGLINVDFANIRQMMMNGGGALLSIGYGQGDRKASQAIEQAIHHPLMDSIQMENATGIIANFSGGSDLAFIEVTEALDSLSKMTNSQAEIVPGIIYNEQLEGRCQVIMVITGLAPTPLETGTRPRSFSEEMAKNPEGLNNTSVERMPVPNQMSVSAPRLQKSPVIGQMRPKNDLDLPAFLRRRVQQ